MGYHSVNIRDAIFSLSDALDLVGITHIHHGKRVAYIASEIGLCLGWNEKWLDRVYLASVLHDCGVSRTQVHKRLIQFEWEKEVGHCEAGARMLGSCPALAHLAPLVLYHHTHWADLAETGLSHEDRLLANCIHLADRVDVLTLKSLIDEPDILLGRNATRELISSKRDDWFYKQFVDAFLTVSRPAAFWLAMEGGRASGYAPKWLSHGHKRNLSFEDFRSLVGVFAQIVDAKSPFTKEHSEGVARLARYLGEQIGLTERSCELLELAGLLHDLGKLRVPDSVLDKNGPLTPVEFAQVQRHSFDGYEILKNVKGLEDVALWASQHHERLDGTGYPYCAGPNDLSIEARIIAIADIFQALAADRPYRKAMPLTEIVEFLRSQAASGKIDASVVECVCARPEECLSQAVRTDQPLFVQEKKIAFG
jgi:HD-GYP domain-containing protein (c-di-GMP phosphodiesterase class II)